MKTSLHNPVNNFLQLITCPLKSLLPMLLCIAGINASAATRTWVGYGAGGNALKTDISAPANWSGGTPLLATDDYVMTFNNAWLGSAGAFNSFTLQQLNPIAFKTLSVSFNGNGVGLKRLIINTSKNLNITGLLSIANISSGNNDHEINFNVTAGTVTCGSISLTANGSGGVLGYPHLELNVSNGASVISTGNFSASTSFGSYTSAHINNSGTVSIAGSTVANSAGEAQIVFNANNSGLFNFNGAVSIGTSGTTGVFLSTLNPGSSTGRFYFRNNLTFGSLGFIDPLYNAQSYTFDGTGSQALSIGNSSVFFSNFIVGDVNSPVVNVSGSGSAKLTSNAASANLSVNNNSILNLGTNTLNRTNAGGILSINENASLKLAGTSGGQTGSNFPLNYSTVNLDLGSTVEYNGVNASTQTIYAVPAYGKLTLTNNSSSGNAIKNISGNVVVRNTLTLNDRISFTIPSGTSLTLKSNATTTARIAQIQTASTVNIYYGGTGPSKGKFVIERYISAVKGWRFLAVPTLSTETIHSAWQEGQAANNNSLAGNGIQLTSNSFPNGYDLYTSTSSLKTYVPGSASWASVPSTLAAFDNSKGGYMTFIRGDRTVNTYNQAPTSTVLRTSGEIYKGDVTVALTTSNQFKAIGNPYASAIDFTQLYSASAGISEQFYVYDPKAGAAGIGGYQTITKIGGIWKAVPGGGSYPLSGSVNPNIESGQAFFVYSTSNSGAVTIKENSKVAPNTLVTRTAAPAEQSQTMQTRIYAINADASVTMLDGVYNEFNSNYSNAVDDLDAKKTLNFGVNLSVKRNGDLLVVDRMQPISTNDTIVLNLAGTRVQQYRFEIVTENMQLNGLQAFLEDSYLHTQTPVHFSDTTRLNFSIANIAGSYAPERFRIVFVKALAPLPVTITDISAKRNAKEVTTVTWKTENEISITNYEAQHSLDGKDFRTISTVLPSNNNGGSGNYKTIHANPSLEDNFYRIKASSTSGLVQYSATVKVSGMNTLASISVHPMPVVGKTMNIRFTNMPEATYSVKLTNMTGQVIYQGSVKVSSTNTTRAVSLPGNTPRGMYLLNLFSENGSKTSQQIFID